MIPWILSSVIQCSHILARIIPTLGLGSFIAFSGPGALPFLSTRHRDFFNHLERLHNSSEIPAFAGGAFNAFRDIESAKRDYDAGRFVLIALAVAVKSSLLSM
jgi:hypothetical protein